MKYTSECLVLKSQNIKDADKIYTFLSKDHGKISALAKGVRKITSRRAGNLDTLNHVMVGVVESPQGYKTITEVKLVESFKKIKADFEISKHAYYVVELVHKFLEEDHTAGGVFDLVLSTLAILEKQAAIAVEANFIVNSFEIKLMGLLGYGMCLDRCAGCGKKYSYNAEVWRGARFDFETGGIYCDDCGVKGITIDNGVAGVLAALAESKYKKSFVLRDINTADSIIKNYVAGILGHGLKTRRVYGV